MDTSRTKNGRMRAAGAYLYAWAAGMILLSSIPGNRLPVMGLWQADKLVHLAEFAVFACLLHRYLDIRWSVERRRLWIFVAAIGAVFGALDEIHQLIVPLRACAWEDMVADYTGVGLGLVWMQVRTRRAAAP